MVFCRAKVLEKEDWKHIVDIVTNAKLVVSSIQDVANKLADYAKVVTTSASSVGKSTWLSKMTVMWISDRSLGCLLGFVSY